MMDEHRAGEKKGADGQGRAATAPKLGHGSGDDGRRLPGHHPRGMRERSRAGPTCDSHPTRPTPAPQAGLGRQHEPQALLQIPESRRGSHPRSIPPPPLLPPRGHGVADGWVRLLGPQGTFWLLGGSGNSQELADPLPLPAWTPLSVQGTAAPSAPRHLPQPRPRGDGRASQTGRGAGLTWEARGDQCSQLPPQQVRTRALHLPSLCPSYLHSCPHTLPVAAGIGMPIRAQRGAALAAGSAGEVKWPSQKGKKGSARPVSEAEPDPTHIWGAFGAGQVRGRGWRVPTAAADTELGGCPCSMLLHPCWSLRL